MTEYAPYEILTAAELNASIDGISASVSSLASSVAASVGSEATRALAAEAILSAGVAGIAIPAAPLAWTGSVARAIASKLFDVMSAADFGVVGNNSADDTTALQAAIGAAEANGRPLLLVGLLGTTFKITRPLVVTGPLLLVGGSPLSVKLVASGNFAAIISFPFGAAGVNIDHVGLDQTGTTTPCVAFAQGAQVIKFTDCVFTGNMTGNLIYSQAAGYVEYWGCVWNCNAAGTQGIALDGFNENPVFMGGHAGGPGQWLIVENSTGNIANNVQGLKATAFTSICTGPQAIQVSGAAFSTQFIGCIIDQAGTNCIIVGGGCSLTQIIGGYWGLSGAAGVPIVIASSAGQGTTINGVETYGGSSAISVQASVSARVSQVNITNNVFSAATTVTVSLDSVSACIITGNVDLGTPSNGSWDTAGTFGPGSYVFGDNNWFTTSPAVFHSASSYHCRPDRGITLANKGVATSPSGTTLLVAHGLTQPPNNIQITQLGGGGMASNVSSIAGANFTISYSAAGAATFMWVAEYYA